VSERHPSAPRACRCSVGSTGAASGAQAPFVVGPGARAPRDGYFQPQFRPGVERTQTRGPQPESYKAQSVPIDQKDNAPPAARISRAWTRHGRHHQETRTTTGD